MAERMKINFHKKKAQSVREINGTEKLLCLPAVAKAISTSFLPATTESAAAEKVRRPTMLLSISPLNEAMWGSQPASKQAGR